MKIVYNLLLTSVLVGVSGCGSSSDLKNTTDNNAEVINLAALKIDAMDVRVHKRSQDFTNEMYKDINKSLSSCAAMMDRVSTTMDLSMKTINTLAQPFKISDDYSNTVALNKNFTMNIPAFTLQNSANIKFFILFSDSRFFLPKHTIKKLVYTQADLALQWTDVLKSIDKNRDLYITLEEIKSDNSLTKVCLPFEIKSSKLKEL